MTQIATTPILPAWFVLPLAIATVLIVSAHLSAMQHTEMPATRRRLRQANGVVMLVATPLLAYAFGIATTRDPRTFAMVWTACTGLLGMVVLLAGLDILNNVRLYASQRRGLEARAAALRAHLARLASNAAAASADEQPRPEPAGDSPRDRSGSPRRHG
ncbi:MAG TPA: hypothetical protein PLU35_13915 [Phycisphaerales bacterium]|nr:hypothetical protein [Phycisphaerales bacterium]